MALTYMIPAGDGGYLAGCTLLQIHPGLCNMPTLEELELRRIAAADRMPNNTPLRG